MAKILSIILLLLFQVPALLSQTDRQIVKNFEKEITIKLATNYLLYLPIDYNSSDKEFPLVLFLHGAGERVTDIEKVKIHELPKLINQGKEFPFILVSPQCPENMFWNIDILAALLDDIEANYRVDKNKIYVTGLSMGGHGTWELAIAQPDCFAAIAPVCGWSDPEKACIIKEVPIWVFHGAKDMVVPVSAAEKMVEKLKSCGSDVKFTVYPEANHDSWTETYNNEDLYSWFLKHSLNK